MAGFPNVPIAPGVPPLLRSPDFVPGFVTILAADALSVITKFLRQPWGLYLNGLPAIYAESVKSLDFRHDYDISDYPLERGSFESYNKVQRPFQSRVRFTAGQSEFSRRALLDSVILAQRSLALYDLVMPERAYVGVNVIHYDFRRMPDSGNGLLTLDVWVQQVNERATAEFTQTQAPSGADRVNSGTVQAVTVNPQPAQSGTPFFGTIT